MAKTVLRKPAPEETTPEVPSTDAETIEMLDQDLAEELEHPSEETTVAHDVPKAEKQPEESVGRPQVFEHPQPGIDNRSRIVHSED